MWVSRSRIYEESGHKGVMECFSPCGRGRSHDFLKIYVRISWMGPSLKIGISLWIYFIAKKMKISISISSVNMTKFAVSTYCRILNEKLQFSSNDCSSLNSSSRLFNKQKTIISFLTLTILAASSCRLSGVT